MMDKDLRLERTVNVSDSWNWYERDTITAQMFPLPTSPDTIRIIFKSIDDFMVYIDFDEWNQEANWKWCEKWLWNHIPNTVNCEWLYTHGYRNF